MKPFSLLAAFSFLTVLLSLFTPTTAHFNQNQSFAVYWGQAEAGEKKQNELAFYCQSDSVDVVVLAFVSQFGKQHTDSTDGFVLNLSNMCDEDDDGHFVCPTVGTDIKTCQGMGKKILLSLGGEAEGDEMYGFEDDDEAREFAHTLWDLFGEGQSDHRPFGTASVDGFDFDIETTDQIGYTALAWELKSLAEEHGSKTYMFTAAPQCTLPEQHMGHLLQNFELDHIYVQFYNNGECELQSGGFNFVQWTDEVANNGHNNTRLFVGLPSSKQAADSGFVINVDTLLDTYTTLNQTESAMNKFGGFMFWDASRGFDHISRDSYEKSYIFRAWSTFNYTEVDQDASGATMEITTDGAPVSSSRPTSSATKNMAPGGDGPQEKYSTAAFLVFLFTTIAFSTL